MPMMGRGSDTRMYSPRSESDKMYSSANEDESKYNPASPEYNEQKREEKKRKEEEKKERRSKIKHIKIRAAQKLDGEESPEGLDDGNKRDDDREMGLTGGPPGSRGTLLDLATGAKSGTGSAMSGPMPIAMSEPMEDAWSEILKRDTPKSIQRRRREEKRREFRPSTGQFKRPPGGMDPTGATMRRFRARMRGIKSGKKTGLMKPHLSVEMSHRGIATKQPMSKDPQKYTAYRGQSEARKILGNVRTPFSPHGRYGERSNYAGPTGAGRISGLLPGQKGMMRQPSLRPIRIRPPRPPMMPRMPRMPRTPMMPMPQSSVPSMPAPPSSIMMSEDEKVHGNIIKARNIVRQFELLNLMRRLIAAKEKEAKKIKKYVQGGGSAFENGHVPDHPAGVQQHEDEDEKNDGPTQNLETNSSRLGLDPAGVLISRRGHMG